MTITRSKCVGKVDRSPRSGRSEATVWTKTCPPKYKGKACIQSGDMKASPLIEATNPDVGGSS